MALPTAPEKIEQIRALWRAGRSIAQICQEARVSNNTVVKYTRGIVERDPCACGKPSGHKGWCWVMIERSPVRRAMIAAWVPHNLKWTDDARAYAVDRYMAGGDTSEIAHGVDKILGTVGTTVKAINSEMGRLGASRPAWYLSEIRRNNRLRHWAREREEV